MIKSINPPVPFSPSTDVADLIRLAAFIDGEGSIVVRWNRSGKPSQARYNGKRYSLMFEVKTYNTDPRLMLWCLSKFGGHSYLGPKERNRNAKNPVYEWRLYGESAVWIMNAIRPYLILKKEQADIALRLRDTVLKRGGKKAINHDLYSLRNLLIENLKTLKREKPSYEECILGVENCDF